MNGITANFPTAYGNRKTERNSLLQNSIKRDGSNPGVPAGRNAGRYAADAFGRRMERTDTAMQAYLRTSSCARTISSVEKMPQYETYTSEHYKIVPDNEAECFTVYDAEGQRLGAFSYEDIKVRQDSATGKQFLISEHGTMSYDALALDDELREGLQSVMGTDSLAVEKMQGFTLKTHAATGIQYLLRDGEEGRGGRVILQSPEDAAKYEELAQEYLNRYPNLIHSREEAHIWADFEIRGLAQHTKQGILSVNRDGMSYQDNLETNKGWSVRFAGDTYQTVFGWFLKNRHNMQDMQKFSVWQSIFKDIAR